MQMPEAPIGLETEEAWKAELKRRVDNYRDGRAQVFEWDTVYDEIRAKFGK